MKTTCVSLRSNKYAEAMRTKYGKTSASSRPIDQTRAGCTADAANPCKCASSWRQW
jgi:hypothetical protein